MTSRRVFWCPGPLSVFVSGSREDLARRGHRLRKTGLVAEAHPRTDAPRRAQTFGAGARTVAQAGGSTNVRRPRPCYASSGQSAASSGSTSTASVSPPGLGRRGSRTPAPPLPSPPPRRPRRRPWPRRPLRLRLPPREVPPGPASSGAPSSVTAADATTVGAPRRATDPPSVRAATGVPGSGVAAGKASRGAIDQPTLRSADSGAWRRRSDPSQKPNGKRTPAPVDWRRCKRGIVPTARPRLCRRDGPEISGL